MEDIDSRNPKKFWRRLRTRGGGLNLDNKLANNLQNGLGDK